MTNQWFTSDTHWSHRNIIKYCKRPFLVDGDSYDSPSYKSVSYMNEALIENWNRVVMPEDEIFHLGDFCFCRDPKDAEKILDRLNGKKYLIKGNHDPDWLFKMPHWTWVKDLHEMTVQEGTNKGDKIILCHYAMRVWHHSYRDNCYMLYGHSHGGLPGSSKSLDVGVDCWNYHPVSLTDIKRRLRTLPDSKDAGHHGD